MSARIVLEEHVSTTENNQFWDDSGEAERNGPAYMADVMERLLDVDERVRAMDRHGIAVSVLSLTAPGVQGIPDSSVATELARRTNDTIRESCVGRHPGRLEFFATVALQEPGAAAHELERAVTELGARGALVNGYTNMPDGSVRYLDAPENEPFWQAADYLGVPVYLHPREPLPQVMAPYAGYDSLDGSAWGFGHETGTHAVRLMLSGLFDRYPSLQVVLGHLGEGLPFLLPRLEHRLYMQREGTGLGSAKRTVTEYFRSNFAVTTSGFFGTPSLEHTIRVIGPDRVMFSVDYPYESMEQATAWFDTLTLADDDAHRLAYGNADRLLGITGGDGAGDGEPV